MLVLTAIHCPVQLLAAKLKQPVPYRLRVLLTWLWIRLSP